MVRAEQPADRGDSNKQFQTENNNWNAALADTYGPGAALAIRNGGIESVPQLPNAAIESDGSINFDAPVVTGPNIGVLTGPGNNEVAFPTGDQPARPGSPTVIVPPDQA